MRVLIAGANGKIGRHLVQQMANSRHTARAMVRRSEQAAELEQLGADETVVADLEEDCSHALKECDAVIFTAGSGPHTGPEKTIDVDQNGAIRLMDAAEAAGVKRFILVSSMRADAPEKAPEKIHHYLRAKHKADEHLRASSLDFTLVRPGPLTNDPGTGKVELSARLDRTGSIPREDVASVLLATLDADNTIHQSFDLLSGDHSIVESLPRL